MPELETKVTLEQVIRKGILWAMVVGFCVFFAYDGFIRYPRKNLENLKKANPDWVPVDDPAVNSAVTVAAAREIEADENVRRMADVVARLGEPDYRSDDSSTVLYFGPAVVLKLTTIGGDLITSRNIKLAEFKTETDFFVQKMFALGLAILAIPLTVHYLKVLTFTARIDDKGLKLKGKPFVPFDAITDVDTSRFKDKAYIEVDYQLDDREGTLRVDDYWFKEYKAFITEICSRKGVENPLEQKEEAGSRDDAAEGDQPVDK
jgi:hypothetical protein